MKITFIIPGIGFSGGNKVIFELANALSIRNHHVTLVYSIFPSSSTTTTFHKSSFLRLLNSVQRLKNNQLTWINLNCELLRAITFSERYIPNSDAIVATGWNTAFDVAKYSYKKGKKLYFIQGYEIWNGPKELVEKTYSLGLGNLVTSNWLFEKIYCIAGIPPLKVPLGIDLKSFYVEQNRLYNRKRVLIPYRPEPWKGTTDGLRAWQIIKQAVPDAKLIMFGNILPTYNHACVHPDEYYLHPSISQLRKIYNSCDIFISPSHTEGFGLTLAEAMACGCATVSTNVGAIADLSDNGRLVPICNPGDYQSLARNAISLLNNEYRLQTIGTDSSRFIQKFSWDIFVSSFEKTIFNIL